MADERISYSLNITGAITSRRLLDVLFEVISVDFVAADTGASGGAWRAEGSGGWSFELRETPAGAGVNAYLLRVDVDPSDRLFGNTCQWFMHPSKFPDFLRRELARDGLEVTQR